MTRAEGTTRSTIGPRSAITRHVFASHVTRHVLAAAIYAGVTVMFCAGIVVHPLTATLTAMGDGFLTFWDFWWVHKALFDLHANPLRTTWLTYPHEISLVFHVLDLLDGVLTLPLQRFSPGLDGVTLAVNVAICLSFLLSALAAYAAALVVTDSWLPSVVAGLGYGFSAYHVSRADMPVTAALYWLPLFAVLAVRAIRDGGIGRMATVGACVGLCTFQSAYHALLLLLLAPFVALVAVRDGLDRRLVLPRLAAVGFAIGIGASPMLTLVGVELQRDHYTTTGVPMGKPVSADVDCRESIDLLGLIVPGPTQGLWRPVAPAWNRYLARPTCPVPMWGENGYGGAQAYVGLVPLCLAGLAIWRSRRRTLPWALGALFFASLALGPNLHVGGHHPADAMAPLAVPTPPVYARRRTRAVPPPVLPVAWRPLHALDARGTGARPRPPRQHRLRTEAARWRWPAALVGARLCLTAASRMACSTPACVDADCSRPPSRSGDRPAGKELVGSRVLLVCTGPSREADRARVCLPLRRLDRPAGRAPSSS